MKKTILQFFNCKTDLQLLEILRKYLTHINYVMDISEGSSININARFSRIEIVGSNIVIKNQINTMEIDMNHFLYADSLFKEIKLTSIYFSDTAIKKRIASITMMFNSNIEELIRKHESTETQISFISQLKESIQYQSKMINEGKSPEYIEAMKLTVFCDVYELAEQVISEMMFAKGFESSENFFKAFKNKTVCHTQLEHDGWKLSISSETIKSELISSCILSCEDENGKRFGLNVVSVLKKGEDGIMSKVINHQSNFH